MVGEDNQKKKTLQNKTVLHQHHHAYTQKFFMSSQAGTNADNPFTGKFEDYLFSTLRISHKIEAVDFCYIRPVCVSRIPRVLVLADSLYRGSHQASREVKEELRLLAFPLLF